MKIIKDLTEYIEEEVHDAEKYIKKALKLKAECPELANTLYRLSVEEMGHMNTIHNEVERIIANYKRDHGEAPSDMKAVYDYVHERAIEMAKDVKQYQAMYLE